MSELTGDSTINDAKAFIAKNAKKGCECPACGQFVKVYYIKLARSMVMALYHIYKTSVEDRGVHDGWVYVPERLPKLARSRSYPKLALWNLLQARTHEKGSKDSGYWKVTDRGAKFLFGGINMPAVAKVFRGDVLGFTGKEISANEAAKVSFDYKDLMGG